MAPSGNSKLAGRRIVSVASPSISFMLTPVYSFSGHHFLADFDDLEVLTTKRFRGDLYSLRVLSMLLLLLLICRLETKSRPMPHVTRSAVFVYLANVLSCEKETLIKRAKRMVLAQHDEKLRRPIALLKEGAFVFQSQWNVVSFSAYVIEWN